MTDQPAAEPTPGPLVCSLCGQGGFRSIGVLPNVEHNLLDCGIATALERDQMADELQHINAILARRPALDDKLSRIGKILHAIKTAAERDRLLEDFERLRDAISDNLPGLSSIDDGTWHEHTGDLVLKEEQWNAIAAATRELRVALAGGEARAVLDEAAK